MSVPQAPRRASVTSASERAYSERGWAQPTPQGRRSEVSTLRLPNLLEIAFGSRRSGWCCALVAWFFGCNIGTDIVQLWHNPTRSYRTPGCHMKLAVVQQNTIFWRKLCHPALIECCLFYGNFGGLHSRSRSCCSGLPLNELTSHTTRLIF